MPPNTWRQANGESWKEPRRCVYSGDKSHIISCYQCYLILSQSLSHNLSHNLSLKKPDTADPPAGCCASPRSLAWSKPILQPSNFALPTHRSSGAASGPSLGSPRRSRSPCGSSPWGVPIGSPTQLFGHGSHIGSRCSQVWREPWR